MLCGVVPARSEEDGHRHFGFRGCVGDRTAFGLRPPIEELGGKAFDEGRPDLGPVGFRMRSIEPADGLDDFVAGLATLVHGLWEDGFATGYYSVRFEDPEGCCLEAKPVPGRRLLGRA